MRDGGALGSQDGQSGVSPSMKKTQQHKQTMVSATIKQLLTARRDNPDDSFKIDGVEIYNVKLIGCLVSVKEQTTNSIYTLEDGTGRIDAKTWADESDESLTERKSRLVEGAYVQVIGTMKEFNGGKSVMAYDIRPVTDFNQITHHLIEAVYQHVCNTKGPAQKTSSFGATSSSNFSSAPIAVWGATTDSKPMMSGNSGGGTHEELILKLFRETPCGDEGISLDVIASRLSSKMGMADVRRAVESLSGEGHLYSTTDDNHFKSTE